ncbi:MAG: hypothetical protein R3B60_01065 [Candidatus Paceibacterota bacterium]
MLNLFPIQFLSLFAYFILRIITGFILLSLSKKHFIYRQELISIIKLPVFPFGKFSTFLLIITEFIISCSLVLGVYTQIGALLLVILSLKMLVFNKYFKHHTIPSKTTYLLLAAIGISLFITGAGVFAFDLPI